MYPQITLESIKNHSDGQAALEVLEVLHTHGYEALFAGGCVRDLLMGRKPKDFDIATNAKPEVVERLFPKTIAVGKQFGIIVVLVPRMSALQNENLTSFAQIEVATFRKDGIYQDGRHPESVEFCSVQEDAFRRDFTINALFYNLKSAKVIDYVGGLNDLQNKTIKAVGDPAQRFAEDQLRTLRALRFACELNFTIVEQTMNAISLQSKNIHKVSVERIKSEFLRGFTAEKIIFLNHLKSTSLLKEILQPRFKIQMPSQHLLKFQWKIQSDSDWLLFLMIHVGEQVLATSVTVENGEPQSFKNVSQCSKIWSDFFKISTLEQQKLNEKMQLLILPLTQIRKGYLISLFLNFTDQDWLKDLTPQLKTNLEECAEFLNQPALLIGEDVKDIMPAQLRGQLLKEARFLQFEKVLKTRVEALVWMDQKLKSIQKQ